MNYQIPTRLEYKVCSLERLSTASFKLSFPQKWDRVKFGKMVYILSLDSSTYQILAPHYCQAQPKPASQSPAGGRDSLIITSVGNHPTTPYTLRHPTPGIVVLPVFVHAVFFITCSVLVQYFFSTCSQLVHTLFLTCL